MAWYALYKWFISFRKRTYVDYISWYKQYLYDEWFNSLSEEEQQLALEYQQKLRDKRKREGEMALARLGATFAAIDRCIGGRMGEYADIWEHANKPISKSKYW